MQSYYSTYLLRAAGSYPQLFFVSNILKTLISFSSEGSTLGAHPRHVSGVPMDANITNKFRDRNEAGKLLARKLEPYKKDRPLILALPRGGVPIGYEVARHLNSPLDVIVVRKLGTPSNPEYGFGAVAPGDVVILDEYTIESLGLGENDINSIARDELEEMSRRITHYKSGTWADTPKEKRDTVIVVDDGLATGVTARAALESVRLLYKPKKLIFASPVCSVDTIETLRQYADDVVCVSSPENLQAIGNWYEDFRQVSDEEVLRDLERANA